MVFDKSLEEMLRPSRDRLFKMLLEIEFSHDLDKARELSAIQASRRTPLQKIEFNILNEKYLLNSHCASKLYPFVSVNLRREYNIIHRRIVNLLYGLV